MACMSILLTKCYSSSNDGVAFNSVYVEKQLQNDLIKEQNSYLKRIAEALENRGKKDANSSK